MESEPAKHTQQQPQEHGHLSAAATSQSLGNPETALQLVVARLWETVKHGADVIVTLRQENAILQSQVASLKQSEIALQQRVDDFLARIDELEESLTMGPGTAQIDRVEDADLQARIGELQQELEATEAQRLEAVARLAKAEAALEAASGTLGEHGDVYQQIMQLRTELEARTQLLQELQESRVESHDDSEHIQARMPGYTIQLEQERDTLAAELEQAVKIIERYRAAGVAHLEDPGTQDQLALFLNHAHPVPPHHLLEVADRLEALANQLDELAGLS
ncbi:MAG: hypothetical protein J5I53_01810 [Bradyrhizobiaceae bacterium]|nr:hypothetical protein [Bradyrhizobiaceae bacterium]